MPVFDLYSRRKEETERSLPDVYSYDVIPQALRVQVCRILEDGIGDYWDPGPYYVGSGAPNNNRGWINLQEIVSREHGVDFLSGDDNANAMQDCLQFIRGAQDVNKWLDLVELASRYVDTEMRKVAGYQRSRFGAKSNSEELLAELNRRFQQASFGYQYESGKLLRIDSRILHAEITQPALQLLSDPAFLGAQKEFLDAHAHYRAGEYKDCAVDALNALESTLKCICDLKGWVYPKGARATDLLKVVKSNGLLPDYLDNSFDQLLATLSSGLPKVRNETGAHGDGAQPRIIPDYVASYALNLAGSKILFLVGAHKSTQ